MSLGHANNRPNYHATIKVAATGILNEINKNLTESDFYSIVPSRASSLNLETINRVPVAKSKPKKATLPAVFSQEPSFV